MGMKGWKGMEILVLIKGYHFGDPECDWDVKL